MSSAFDKARVPVIALDYDKKYLCVKKELMVDYTNGKIYIVSSTDKEKIFDITAQIVELVKTSITANDVMVNITGIGDISLKNIIERLYGEEVNFEIEEEKDFAPGIKVDNASININDGDMQINNFDTATEGQCPVKSSLGSIVWKPLPIDESALVLPTGSAETVSISGTDTAIKHYSLSADGIYKIVEVYGTSHTFITLQAPSDNYTKIKALVYIGKKNDSDTITVGSHKLIVTNKVSASAYFSATTNTDVLWDTTPTSANINAPIELETETYYVLTLETFTQGVIWLGSIKKFATKFA